MIKTWYSVTPDSGVVHLCVCSGRKTKQTSQLSMDCSQELAEVLQMIPAWGGRNAEQCGNDIELVVLGNCNGFR